MQRIELKCKCGASIVLEDSRGSFLKGGGKKDEKGRIFVIERLSDEWQERHEDCLERNKA